MAEYDEPLSDRELDVLSCLAEGASNRAIAQQLSISHNTVKVHLRNIYAKLGVSSRTEATTVALQKGVLTIPGIEVETEEAEPAPTAAEDASIEQGPSGAGATTAEAKSATVGLEVPQEKVADSAAGDVGLDPTAVIQGDGALGVRSANRRLLFLIGLLALIALVLAAVAVRQTWWGAAAASLPETDVEPVTTTTVDTLTEDEVAPTEAVEDAAEAELGANWRQGSPLSQARTHMAVVSVGLNVYQIGGEIDGEVTNEVDVYDSQAQQWLSGQPKITAVADAAAAVLGGEIYVVGGRLENGQATGVVEAYSPLNDGWRPVTPLPRPVTGGLAVAANDALYLFGGERNGEVLAESYRFDLTGQQWEEIPAMTQARVFASGGLLSSLPHVVGGSDGDDALPTCERFDPASESWALCPEMHFPREAAAATVVRNKLYVIGGANGSEAFLGEVYADDGGWSEMEVPPALATAPGWVHLGVASVETQIYALGGMLQGEPSDEMFIYAPLVYQFFIPAASSAGD